MAPRWTLLCAGLWMLLARATSQLSKKEAQEIVDLHNMYRSMVEPEAANMMRMVWGQELSLVAKAYAANCTWEHNPLVQNVMGENLFISTGPFRVYEALSDWFKEREDYVYNNDTCPEDKMCGHYTQVVWAETTMVGCAAHLCETVEGLNFKNSTLLVCNYSPPGNVFGHIPYEAGAPCSQCPQDAMQCEEKVCTVKETQNNTEGPNHTEIQNRTEFLSVSSTEQPWTDSADTFAPDGYGSGSKASPAALLLLTGLLACLLWM